MFLFFSFLFFSLPSLCSDCVDQVSEVDLILRRNLVCVIDSIYLFIIGFEYEEMIVWMI